MSTKTRAQIKETFGDRFKDMVGLYSLYTHPAKQGQGFGTALVKLITDKVYMRTF